MTRPEHDIEVSADDALRVAPLIGPHIRRTPLVRSEWLSAALDRPVWLKCENLQVTGSFKARGAFAALMDQPPRAVAAASAGNHGQALALAAQTLGIPCTIVVPRDCPQVKIDGIRRWGAQVIQPPEDFPNARIYDGADAYLQHRAPELGATIISAFEDPVVVAGNGGTLGLEILDGCPDVGTVVVPCGGGGCVGGIAVVTRARAPDVRVVGVNTDASPGMWRSFRDGHTHLTVPDAEPTVADGLEGGVRHRSYGLCRRVVHHLVLAREPTIRRTVVDLALREKLITEGSGAAGVAALLDGNIDLLPGPVVVVLTGGNIDGRRLVELLGTEAPSGMAIPD